MKPYAWLILITLALQGCATMSVDECATADWRGLGFEDGSKGDLLTQADKRESACMKHGFAMDRTAYESGRYDGLGLYCQEGTGYNLGKSGRTYNGVCTDHDEGRFLDAYNRGFELYTFTSVLASAQTKLKSAQSRHGDLDAKLEKYSSGYRDEGLSMEEHNKMVLELWAERKYLAKEAIPYWTFAKRDLQAQLNDYQAKVAAGDPSVGTLQPRQFPGPESYPGPTKDDAREMFREVLSGLQK